jgi:hypothetical protein
MGKNILITGASGLVGSRLTERLLQKGYHVVHLGRAKKQGKTPSFRWDIVNGEIDADAFTGIDAIVHLAGAGVADKRWTEARKKEILESRTKSTALLFEKLKSGNHQVKTFVSASAMGYYGFVGDSKKEFFEDDAAGTDFLAQVTKQWEEEVDKISSLGIRTCKMRIGIVLSGKGGALKQMAAPIKYGVGAPLGTGKQILPWIHIDDLCSMFIKAIEDDKLQGAYNATGASYCTNAELTKVIAKVLHKPLWLPNVPGFVLKIMLGEMAEMVLSGSKVSSKSIQQAGFEFKFTDLEKAVADLLN